jgi:hypothetical protein
VPFRDLFEESLAQFLGYPGMQEMDEDGKDGISSE